MLDKRTPALHIKPTPPNPGTKHLVKTYARALLRGDKAWVKSCCHCCWLRDLPIVLWRILMRLSHLLHSRGMKEPHKFSMSIIQLAGRSALLRSFGAINWQESPRATQTDWLGKECFGIPLIWNAQISVRTSGWVPRDTSLLGI